ncbi:MAG: hypothetical protein IT452_18555 [Planctomycetia bacterium]|nr:hypothetical protein [Planctomycetia bacterium]
MTGRRLAVVAALIAAGVLAWWLATAPSRRSSAILRRLERASPAEAAPVLRELAAVYASSPRQARPDFDANPALRPLIASAAACAPGCLDFVESTLPSLENEARFAVILSLCLDDAPELAAGGSWTGTQPLKPRPDALPALRRILDAETSQAAAVLLASALAAGGEKPTVSALVERVRDPRRPLASRAGEVIAFSDRRDGPADLMRVLREGGLPDDVASALVESNVLDRDPAWKDFARTWALAPQNAAAAGGAFTALYDLLPVDRDRLWGAVSSAERGRRTPLMLALMRRSGWPASWRRWWLGVYDDEKRAVPDLEQRLSQAPLAEFAKWVADEKDEESARAIRAVLERLRELDAGRRRR